MVRKVFKQLPSGRFHNFLIKYKINPNYFTINRRFVSKAVLIGLFFALLPIPFQLLIVTLMTAVIRFNIVVALSIVLLTNPFTMPFILFAEYQLGSTLIQSGTHIHMQLSMEWFQNNYEQIFLPLIIGAFTLATALSTISYFLVEVLWIKSAKKAYRTRKLNQ